jgi:hypothetical protein
MHLPRDWWAEGSFVWWNCKDSVYLVWLTHQRKKQKSETKLRGECVPGCLILLRSFLLRGKTGPFVRLVQIFCAVYFNFPKPHRPYQLIFLSRKYSAFLGKCKFEAISSLFWDVQKTPIRKDVQRRHYRSPTKIKNRPKFAYLAWIYHFHTNFEYENCS